MSRNLAFAFVFIGSLCCAVTVAANEKDINRLHSLAWDQCLDSAVVVPAARYAPYAYRSVAVHHPEIYLRADEYVSIAIEDLPGSRLAYHTVDVRDVELYLRLARRETKGGSFSWDMFAITPDSIYDAGSPRTAQDWFDMRAPSVAILLRAASPRLSTFECALLRHSQLTRTGVFSDDLFVAVDKDGVGYLATDTSLWIAGLSNRPVKNWGKVRPVLIIGKASVYSVLSNRDDRASDPHLDRILARLGKPARLSFGKDDNRRLSQLQSTTTLADSSAMVLAALLASGLFDHTQPAVETAWTSYTNAGSKCPSCASLLLNQSVFWANRLSRRCAELATAIGPTLQLETLSLTEKKYLSWVGRRINPRDSSDMSTEAWGGIWSYDLLTTSIDDNARTRAGSSASQAMAMSAALDLAGIEHYQLGVRLGDLQVPDQQWLFADNGRYQFNFGIWRGISDSLWQGRRQITLLTTGYTVRGVATRIEQDGFCSPLDPLTIVGHLTRISRELPHASLVLMSPNGETTTLQNFLAGLTEEHFVPASCPWPSFPSEKL